MTASLLLREARRGAGLTQRELAERAGTSQPAVVRYETGQVVPRADTLERLLRVCGRGLGAGFAGHLDAIDRLRGPVGRRVARLRARVSYEAARAGASNVRVFGSVARSQDRPDSDVDLLVDLDEDRTLLDVVGLADALSELLQTHVDVATEDILRPQVRVEALRDAVPL